MAPRFFLSYRRADGIESAKRLRDRLITSFAEAHVFMDLQAISPGDDFPQTIAHALDETDLLLALIGPVWLGADSSSGQRRIDDERDFVRIEVATALEKSVPVLPVVIDEAVMPSPRKLPLDIGMLGRLNALRLQDATFDADSASVVEFARDLLEVGQRPRAGDVPRDLVGTWVSSAMGDAILQYDLYPNRTYQHVGMIRQRVTNGIFEFEVFHEGAVTFDGRSITFEAFRATASRRHPDYPAEDYQDQDRRPETATFTWRLQTTGSDRILVLEDGSTPAVAYHHIGRPQASTRARQTPVTPITPPAAHEAASGEPDAHRPR